jgi:hypothetical protein
MNFGTLYGTAQDYDHERQNQVEAWVERGDHIWKGNPHWMRHFGDPPPTHDPPVVGCESCFYLDESGDVRGTDLIWVTGAAWWPEGRGGWLCMVCD